jgi:HKD family nuclease
LDALAGLIPEAREPWARPAERNDALTWVAPPGERLATATPPELPLHGLVHPSFLFNGPTDVKLIGELAREFASAEQVDAVVAFLKRSGLRLLLEPLRRFRDRCGPDALRLITTTYTGATEADAVDQLASLGFAVKVAREEDGTRLHAKAWCFRRPSGLSTVYVGSSNLSHSAMVDGVEWNVRVTQAITPALIERFDTAFGQLWGELGPRPGAHTSYAWVPGQNPTRSGCWKSSRPSGGADTPATSWSPRPVRGRRGSPPSTTSGWWLSTAACASCSSRTGRRS